MKNIIAIIMLREIDKLLDKLRICQCSCCQSNYEQLQAMLKEIHSMMP